MKKFDERKEFERMRKMYENDYGVHDYMDLVTFARNYYENLVRKYHALAKFWSGPLNLPKKKVVVKVKKSHESKQEVKHVHAKKRGN